jgi:hypothetical protein
MPRKTNRVLHPSEAPVGSPGHDGVIHLSGREAGARSGRKADEVQALVELRVRAGEKDDSSPSASPDAMDVRLAAATTGAPAVERFALICTASIKLKMPA